MIDIFDFWQFGAGLGIFLFGMMLIEGALEKSTGRTFKKWLQNYTRNPLQAIFSGTFVTAILQSSSVVSLMVLAFVGAGIMELRNAIGIIIGSNLGTTLTGWLVAYFGFSFNIEDFAFPLLAIGGLSMVFLSNNKKLYEIGRLLAGFGLLFLGLDFMKGSIDDISSHIDIQFFAGFSPYWLFLFGFVLTAIIQSSSASMVITLSALYGGVISLEGAAAMVIGSDLGTTITVLLGGLKGTAAKKRVALSHFLFNFVVDIIAIIFLFPLLSAVKWLVGVENPLITLVAFHSSFNLLGILLFLPFINLFARFLEGRFAERDLIVAKYIHKVPVEVPEAALAVIRKEIGHLIQRVFNLHNSILNKNLFKNNEFKTSEIETSYEEVKELEGELMEYYIRVTSQELEQEEAARARQLLRAIRHSMSAAKSIKDIRHNLFEYEQTIDPTILDLIKILKKNQEDLYKMLYHIFESPLTASHFELLTDLTKKNKDNFNKFLKMTYPVIQQSKLNDLQISTLLNVNREMLASNKALIHAVKDYLLPETEAGNFEELPTYPG